MQFATDYLFSHGESVTHMFDGTNLLKVLTEQSQEMFNQIKPNKLKNCLLNLFVFPWVICIVVYLDII